MSFDHTAAVGSLFPNPAEQAEAILESSDGDVQAARSLVWARIRHATKVDEIRYWCQVESVLAQQAASFDINAPSDEEAAR